MANSNERPEQDPLAEFHRMTELGRKNKVEVWADLPELSKISTHGSAEANNQMVPFWGNDIILDEGILIGTSLDEKSPPNYNPFGSDFIIDMTARARKYGVGVKMRIVEENPESK